MALRAGAAALVLGGAACGETAVSLGTANASSGAGDGAGLGGSSGAGSAGVTIEPNPLGCPPAEKYVTEPGATCTMDPQDICHYQRTNGWLACSCSCEVLNQWTCQEDKSTGSACPLDQPREGAKCSEFDGAECDYYPHAGCICAGDRWHCEYSPSGGLAVCEGLGYPPSEIPGVPRGDIVGDLTGEEVSTWCEWFELAGFPGGGDPPHDWPVDADGTVSGDYEERGDTYCIERLSVGQCSANLELFDCRSTVGELTDCVETTSFGRLVGNGCSGYLADASCNKTIVITQPPGPFCKVPVE